MRRLARFALPIALAAGLLAALPAAAAGLPTLVPPECQGTATLDECGLNSVVQVFINIAQFIFGISGAAALAMFVWGGFLWLTSAGSAEKIKQGQSVIVGAVIGLVIIFGAYIGVQFLIQALRGTVGSSEVMIAGEHCGSGTSEGLAVYTGSDAAAATGGLECVPFGDCGRIGRDWTRVPLTDSNRSAYTCVDGLFPHEAENIKCCLRTGTETPATGGTTPEGTSGRNNCTCADRGVNSVPDCTSCTAFCTSRGSTMSAFNAEARTTCP